MSEGVRIRVGQAVGADLVGCDQRVLQAAVEYVAALGGGVVEVGPGVYTMHDSLHLRGGVSVVGAGEGTVLRKAPAAVSPLLTDADYGEEAITVRDGAGFDPGCGVAIWDEQGQGFHLTVARIVEELPAEEPGAYATDRPPALRAGHGIGGWDAINAAGVANAGARTVRVTVPMQADYSFQRGGQAATIFPIVSGYHLSDVRIASLSIEGASTADPVLNGCRGAGIFLYRCHEVTITDCTVRDYRGDGISFQTSNDIRVERCVCTGNAGLGIHPGSGSQRPVVLDCQAIGNGKIGLYVCWRVRDGHFARLLLQHNGQDGLSIGHKDTDNVFEDVTSESNGRYGLHFRDEPAALAAHRNHFLRTRIAGNRAAAIRVDGATSGLHFEELDIGDPWAPEQAAGAAISVGPGASKPEIEGLRLVGGLSPRIAPTLSETPTGGR